MFDIPSGHDDDTGGRTPSMTDVGKARAVFFASTRQLVQLSRELDEPRLTSAVADLINAEAAYLVGLNRWLLAVQRRKGRETTVSLKVWPQVHPPLEDEVTPEDETGP